MIEVETEISEWSRRYGVAVVEDKCPKCAVDRVADRPVAIKGYRGFVSLAHDCGPRYRLLVVVPVGEEAAEWKKITG